MRWPAPLLGLDGTPTLLTIGFCDESVNFSVFEVVSKFICICSNVVSFSDGLPKQGSGIPYFYLTTLDPTARNALKDERASFTVSEYPLGTCGTVDPENPTCSKISLTGKVCEKMNSIEYDYAYAEC